MSVTVPQVPYRAKVLDQNGLLTPAWAGWFRMLFLRIGETVADSNLELAGGGIVSTTLTSLQNQINTINTTLTSLQGQITGIDQGPDL